MADVMKKVLVGLGVVGVFIVYSLWVRHERPVITPVATAAPAMSSSAPNESTNPSSSSAGPSNSPDNSPANQQNQVPVSAQYKDGTYSGSTADAYYGNVQVKATVSGGKLADVSFLQYPDTHDTSVMINQQAMPYLKQEAISAQSANVQIISGATFTSQAFIQSLSAALSQAKA